MTKAFEDMLYLFGCGARNLTYKQNSQINIEQIYQLAVSQNTWQVIFPMLQNYPDAQKYKSQFLNSVAVNIRKKEFTLSVIQGLETMGIKCCMLKGDIVAKLYSEPDCRISSDTDIIIDPADEKKVAKFLTEKGYSVENRHANDHHMKACHKIGGLLEVHVRLYSLPTEQVVFNGIKIYNNEFIKNSSLGYHTLSIDDNLMYLTAHYIKHFMTGGGGIRQMMDLLLYMENNKAEIDFERYNALLEEMRYTKLIDIVKSIGTKYFGFDYPLVADELMDKILTDTEVGGIFGRKTKDRVGFYKEFCKHRTTKSKLVHEVYMATKSEQTLFRKILPTKQILIKMGYWYAKHTFLLPIAHLHRLFNVLLKKLRRKFRLNNGNTARLNMMRELDIID